MFRIRRMKLQFCSIPVVLLAIAAFNPLFAAPSEATPLEARTQQAAEMLPVVERSRHATHYRLPDGSTRALLTIHAQNFRDADGEWRPIVEEVRESPKRRFLFENRENALLSLYPQNALDGVRFRGHATKGFTMRPGRLVALSDGQIQGAIAAQASIAERYDEKRVHYPQVFPGATDEFEIGPSRVKHSLLLDDLTTLDGLTDGEQLGATYELALPAGFTVEETARTIRLLNPQGECVYEIGPVTHYDQAGATVAGGLRLEHTSAGLLELTLTAPMSWLLAEERAWPVRLDPPVTFQPDSGSSNDAFIRENRPSNNYGTHSQLTVNYAGNDDYLDPLVQFDISSLPTNAHVLEARFEWYHRTNNRPGHVARTYLIEQSWQSGSVTWNTQPNTASSHFDELTYPSGSGSWRVFDDFDSVVQDWLDGAVTNYGFRIINNSEPSWETYHKSSYNSYASRRPRLIVDYRPDITNVAPDPVEWLQTLTIDGGGLGNASDVTIGGVSQTITNNTSTEIEVTVSDLTPIGTQPVEVIVGSATSNTVNVEIDPIAPDLTSLSPDPVRWVETLTIDGDVLGSVTTVEIGGVAQTIDSATSSSLEITVSHDTPLGVQTVEVTNAVATVSNLSVTVEGGPPRIDQLTPGTVEWLDTLTVTGQALADADSVMVAGVEAAIQSNTADEIVLEVPVTSEGGEVTLEVVTPYGSDVEQVTITGNAPLVNETTPTPVHVGRELTITGENLLGVFEVLIGEAEATIESTGEEELVVRIPSQLQPGEYALTVTNAFGTDDEHFLEVRSALSAGSGGCTMDTEGRWLAGLAVTALVLLLLLGARRYKPGRAFIASAE